nr:retrovirus-related Pol polyprotein from transposon TNT 1-94 [Tanacetum cinerariifolium]
MVEDRIMNSGASFHATYCKEELERFKLRSGKVRLADDKTLDIASVGDVVLKNSFGTSWTLKDVREDKETAETAAEGVVGIIKTFRIVMLKMVSKTPLQLGVAERLSQTFTVESIGPRVEASKILWADSVSTANLIYRIPYFSIGLRIPEEEWQGKDTSLTQAAAQMKCDTAFGIRRVTKLSEAEILHLWTQFMEPENDSIVAEHGLSLEITQSPGGSSDTSEGSENSRSFEDSRDQMKNTLKTEHPPRREALRLYRYTKSLIHLVKNLKNEEPCSDVHQVGDERKVKVLRSFNWPPSELIIDDGVLPERGYLQFNDVSSGYLVPKDS